MSNQFHNVLPTLGKDIIKDYEAAVSAHRDQGASEILDIALNELVRRTEFLVGDLEIKRFESTICRDTTSLVAFRYLPNDGYTTILDNAEEFNEVILRTFCNKFELHARNTFSFTLKGHTFTGTVCVIAEVPPEDLTLLRDIGKIVVQEHTQTIETILC